jgi:hypothetical protein
LLVEGQMYESPQSFASKAAIIDIFKRASDASFTRSELVAAVCQELSAAPPDAAEVLRAIDEMALDAELHTELVSGVEMLRFAGGR